MDAGLDIATPRSVERAITEFVREFAITDRESRSQTWYYELPDEAGIVRLDADGPEQKSSITVDDWELTIDRAGRATITNLEGGSTRDASTTDLALVLQSVKELQGIATKYNLTDQVQFAKPPDGVDGDPDIDVRLVIEKLRAIAES